MLTSSTAATCPRSRGPTGWRSGWRLTSPDPPPIDAYPAGVADDPTRELGTGDLEEFRRTGHALVDAVVDQLAALPGQPVCRPMPEELRWELLSLPLPDGPTELGPLAATMARDVLPYAMGNE